jgi:hypothetical protein
MKSIVYILNTSILILSFVSNVFSQSLDDAYRGHSTDDFYFVNTAWFHLYYINDDGNNIVLKNTRAGWHKQYVTESTPGVIFTLQEEGIAKSLDYGNTFSELSPSWLNADTSIHSIRGGEVAGLFYTGALSYGDPNWLYFKTFDSFSTIEAIGNYPLEVGFAADEYYGGNFPYSNSYLTHTMNAGMTYDTMYIADTIINENFRFWKLSRGAMPGELYMVTMLPAAIWDYQLYHSIDYGATWTEKNIPSGLSEGYFTAGRGNCKFYVVDKSWNGNPNYTMDIYASSDCGETYTKHTYQLPTYLNIEERNRTISNLAFSPNPTSDQTSVSCTIARPAMVSLAVYNSLGKCVLQTSAEMQQAGVFSKVINFRDQASGLYSVHIVADGEIVSIGKLLATK